MSNKRVFVLGAGFSKQAGLPLATELTSLILDGTELGEPGEMQAWLDDLRQRVAATEGLAEDRLNIEQLFDFAGYDEELWRMRQQLESVGRIYGDTAWSKADSVSTWLGYMEQSLAHLIWDAQRNADRAPIERFTHRLSPDDTVLTFNYDTLVEQALSTQHKAWNHGLNDRGAGGVTILKMHGSIDWIQLERRDERELQKFIKLFSKDDLNVSEHGSESPAEHEYAWELWRPKDSTACDTVIEIDKNGLSNFPYSLGLAGLGRYKPLHRLAGNGQTWVTAFKALSEAEEICVVGFSMSPYDTMTRFHFSTVIRDREKPPLKVVIADPSAIRLAKGFASVFGGSLTVIAKPAEELDWHVVLA